MDSTVGFYPTNVGSIPAGQANGDISVEVRTRLCESRSMGSFPICYPKIPVAQSGRRTSLKRRVLRVRIPSGIPTAMEAWQSPVYCNSLENCRV